jgi:putative ABC transport system permease protein
MLETLGSILDILTLAVAAIGAISLLVGGIGITTIMTIAVSERTSEVGLLRALGAEQQQILILFMGEAVTLGALGGAGGLILGVGSAQLLHAAIPALPVHLSGFYIALAEAVAITIGLVAGLVPARQAARLDPVAALRAE